MFNLMNIQINNTALELSLFIDTYFMFNKYVLPLKKL